MPACRRRTRVWGTVLLAALLGSAVPARAQAIDAALFHPTPTANGFFSVDGAFPVRHLGGTGGVYADYAHDPLVLRRPDGTIAPGGALVENQLGLDVVASFGLVDRLELGIDLPLIPYANGQGALDGTASGAGLGDLRVDLKVLLLGRTVGAGHRIGLTLIAGGSVPTSSGDHFLGQDGYTGRPRLVLEWRAPRERVALALNAGAVFRGERHVGDLTVGTEVRYGLGARVHLGAGIDAMGEFAGLVGVAATSGPSSKDAPGELLLGLRWRTRFGLEVSAAGGAGLTRGYGTSDARALIGLRYQSPPAVASLRSAPPLPALRPLPRPSAPSAPAGVDSDGDGVIDLEDRCPFDVGPPSRHGCPEDDRDGDGVPDASDRCPDQKGSRENDGCADVDSDGDGIVDRLDKCPFDPEVFNGLGDDDGCPDPGAPLAVLRADRIQALESILFDGASSSTLDPRSHRVLEVIAHLLELHPEITRVRVEGHTDNRGSPVDNLDLSRARAAAVRRHLIQVNGVAAARLMAQGFGPDRPIADNRSEAGRARNRRIEFIILERAQP
jgi:outer membrane protein OmpA-like peptidoglycan-associated protein